MPRRPRLVIPGQPQHIIIRGVNREPVFYAEVDYRFYLKQLQVSLAKYSCDLHTYVLMTNHVHMLITPWKETDLGRAIQSLGRCYVQYFNNTYKRTGTLWEGRYKAALVDSERYLLVCYRYIELNPVRAGMVDHPAKYPWSSFRYNGLGQADPLIKPHEKYLELGSDKSTRCAGYRALFQGHVTNTDLIQIREMTNKEWVLGSDCFKEQIKRRLHRQVEPTARGGDRKSRVYRQANRINRH